jgi:hypothetical protein
MTRENKTHLIPLAWILFRIYQTYSDHVITNDKLTTDRIEEFLFVEIKWT